MKGKISYLVLAGVLAMTGCSAPAEAEPRIESEEEKTLYALGLALTQRLQTFEFTEEEVALLQAGIHDGLLAEEAKVELEEFGPKIDPFLQARMEVVMEREKSAGIEFLAEQAKLPGAEKTESGMIYQEQKAGDGASPSAADKVSIHYHGTFRDGSVFDSSIEKDEPASFQVGGVVPCFSEGLQRMKVGGKSRLVCPPELAYGERGYPPKIPPGATLVFEIELLEIVDAGSEAPTPTP